MGGGQAFEGGAVGSSTPLLPLGRGRGQGRAQTPRRWGAGPRGAGEALPETPPKPPPPPRACVTQLQGVPIPTAPGCGVCPSVPLMPPSYGVSLTPFYPVVGYPPPSTTQLWGISPLHPNATQSWGIPIPVPPSCGVSPHPSPPCFGVFPPSAPQLRGIPIPTAPNYGVPLTLMPPS